MLQAAYENSVLVAENNTADEESEWIDVSAWDALRIIKKHTTGTYVLNVVWSNDAVAEDFVDAITISDNEPVEVKVSARWAKIQVQNSHATDAFTAHKTIVSGVF